ncbi:MAG: hypothetical protein CSA11_04915 [Chloroflexi bacterium]|nr:MAG: hypothetical protein CSB13_01615 [Chloroflexota bacterium]PIE81338.1 MAG: hypothetical protein CSA11_04915 [Chloroflexota bacterium]
MSLPKIKLKISESGQSLVEFALILPILIIILAGTVEVANILVTKNRVETAARAAARHASNGGDNSHIVVLNSVTQTLNLESGFWDIWTIEATTNADGTGFDPGSWVVNHIYGLGHTSSFTQVANRISEDCLSDCISTDIIEELQGNAQANIDTNIAQRINIVGVFVIHDIESILGLNVIPAYQGFTSVEGLGVMRMASQSIVDTTEGCTVAFPIGVTNGIRSIDQATFDSIQSQLDSPNPPMNYYSFSYHNPNIPLENATDGDIYYYHFDTPLQAIWLSWNQYLSPANNNLSASLAWPGNTSDYNDCAPEGCTGPPGYYIQDESNHVWGFAEVGDTEDRDLGVNDRVAANVGASISNGAVTNALSNHVISNRALRLPVLATDFRIDYAGAYPYVEVQDFVIMRIRGYSTSENWLLLEFVRFDHSCGQE